MEENTPRFCQILEKTEELKRLFSFSVEYKKTSRIKCNSKHHSKGSSIHQHSSSKHKKSKKNGKCKSNKLELPETSVNFDSNKELSIKCNIFTINEFLNKSKFKFKLNNNFDRKNSKKFLSSKKEAFEKPFFLMKY